MTTVIGDDDTATAMIPAGPRWPRDRPAAHDAPAAGPPVDGTTEWDDEPDDDPAGAAAPG